MKVIVAPTKEAATPEAAGLVERFVRDDHGGARVLGLAVGETMRPLFAELVRRHRHGGLSFASVDVYLLDEYVGLGPEDPNLFSEVMRKQFVEHSDIGVSSFHYPNPQAADLDVECARYEREVRFAQVGLQFLGLGLNGHIGFNEPGSAADSVTRMVELSEQTRVTNAASFPEPQAVPKLAITQGISTIMSANRLVLMAFGSKKANIVARALQEPATCEVPASLIRDHTNLTVLLDPPAASSLSAIVASRTASRSQNPSANSGIRIA